MLPLLDLARPSRAVLTVDGGGCHCVLHSTLEAKLSVSAISMMATVRFHRYFAGLSVHTCDCDWCWGLSGVLSEMTVGFVHLDPRTAPLCFRCKALAASPWLWSLPCISRGLSGFCPVGTSLLFPEGCLCLF